MRLASAFLLLSMKKRYRLIFPFFVAAAAMLLTSCAGWVQWNVGGRIRAGSATHAGADIHGPTIEYEKKGNKDAPTYCRAPEVLYRTKPAIIKWRDPFFPDNEDAYDIRPTGRKLLFCRKDRRLVSAVPQGYEATYQPGCKCGRTNFNSSELGSFESPQTSRGSISAQLAAAPFDFFIDPALSVITTAGAYTGMTCAGILLLPVVLINPDAFP